VDEAGAIFESALPWLREHYAAHRFFVERDLVWTIQVRIDAILREANLPYRVFNDVPLLPGPRRGLSADIVIVDEERTPLVAAEFKFEPSHRRANVDIWLGKFPVIGWANVAHDIVRIQSFIDAGRAVVAYAVAVDEGGYFRHRPAIAPGAWQDWGAYGMPWMNVSVHWARIERAGGTLA
jgi:hypothetical protein